MTNSSESPLSVLVVDDEPDVAWSASELLSLWGYEPRVALCGADALRLAAAEPPDVVLLDVRMPGLDGWRLAQLLRDSARGRQPVIAAVTGCGRDADHLRSADAGIDLHLVKPVDPAALLALLARLRRLLRGPAT